MERPTPGFDRLEPFLEEAKAGAPTSWLAHHAEVSIDTVQRWRRHRGIVLRGNRGRKLEATAWALDVFGDGFDPVLHKAKNTNHGVWEVPEFVIRKPLDYDEFCRMVWELHNICGHEPDRIAGSVGVREKDVELALSLQRKRLEVIGVACPRCGLPMDPMGGRATCSKACR